MTDERKSKVARTKKAQAKKELLIECAEELFDKKGYDNVDISDIIEAAGVAHGTFYYYFKSKEDVIVDIAEQGMSEIIPIYRDLIHGRNYTALEKLRVFRKIIRQRRKGRGRNFFKALYHYHSFHLINKFRWQLDKSMVPVFVEIIQEGNANGEWSIEHPLESVQLYLAILHNVADSDYADETGLSYSRKVSVAMKLIRTMFGSSELEITDEILFELVS